MTAGQRQGVKMSDIWIGAAIGGGVAVVLIIVILALTFGRARLPL